jgi:hypothetical protein
MPERRRAAPPRTADRLGRMLLIVPYLVQHPGSELGEVASAYGVKPEQLRRDLDLLFMSGLPPYGPGDLIDVEVDEDDRIWITMADHFSRPLRLSRQEALAITLRSAELLATPGLPQAPALASAVRKLRDALGPETVGNDDAIATADAGRPPVHLEELRAAARDRRRITIEYFAGSTGAWSTRDIEPEEVFSAMGNWYVAAWLASLSESKVVLLLLINLFLLFVGLFMEMIAALVILVPILVPVVAAAGVSPLQFGIVIVMNLVVGALTPPLGVLVFTTARVGGADSIQVFRAILPFIAALLIVLLLVTFVPALVLVPISLLGP